MVSILGLVKEIKKNKREEEDEDARTLVGRFKKKLFDTKLALEFDQKTNRGFYY